MTASEPHLRDYAWVLDDLKQFGADRHLLLGNGFSRGADEGFSYEAIFKQACEADGFDEVEPYFDPAGTPDFEAVLYRIDRMRKINSADMAIASHYGHIYEQLQAFFAKSLQRQQPLGLYQLGPDGFKQASSFLNGWQNLFSLNFDLTVYLASQDSISVREDKYKDGFWCEFPPDDRLLAFAEPNDNSPCRVNLHGGIAHATHVDGTTTKVRRLRTEQQAPPLSHPWVDLMELDDENPEDLQLAELCHRYAAIYPPLIVLQGTATRKKQQIAKNKYLSWCFRRFCEARGALVIYGWSMADVDEHLREAIRQSSGLEAIYVGLYGSSSSSDNQRLISAAHELMRESHSLVGPLTIEFFQSETAHVWDPQTAPVLGEAPIDIDDLPFP